MIEYSPAALALMLLVILIFSQAAGKKFYWIHYLFFASIVLFYFLFLSYTIRFFHVGICISISTAAMGLMAIIYFPAVLGRQLFLKKVLPFLLLLTLGFSLVFLIPVIQGIAFLILLFGVFLALMVVLSKSDFAKWPLMEKETGAIPPSN
jgi:inner membrane protein involved in colicin E2 resistance